ncbi:MAG TPA: hypothetical protein VFQ61_04310 [Polyangiaceae bacterium]|nr:hypothetical protein [Polyangiaceae bacterium]
MRTVTARRAVSTTYAKADLEPKIDPSRAASRGISRSAERWWTQSPRALTHELIRGTCRQSEV